MASPMRARLTEADIRRLVKSRDDDERAAAAHKLCRAIDRAELGDLDMKAAQRIIRIMADDAAELVRRALAVTLRCSDVLPRDVAMKLAQDVDSIALPVIGFSPVFTDEDLIRIVRAGDQLRQVAVASRPFVGREVASAIAAEGVEAAVRALSANDNADLSEQAMGEVLNRFGSSGEVVTALAYRRVLPLDITERLIEAASESVRAHLVSRHAIAPEVAIRLAADARERATVDLIDQAEKSHDLGVFCQHLDARGQLNASLLLRALARGSMPFFEHALSVLAGVPHARAWLMIHDAGALGLRAIYDRAGLPPRLFTAFRAGVDTWAEMLREGVTPEPSRFQNRMLERFLTQRAYAPREDVAYLMDRLDMSAPPSLSAANAA